MIYNNLCKCALYALIYKYMIILPCLQCSAHLNSVISNISVVHSRSLVYSFTGRNKTKQTNKNKNNDDDDLKITVMFWEWLGKCCLFILPTALITSSCNWLNAVVFCTWRHQWWDLLFITWTARPQYTSVHPSVSTAVQFLVQLQKECSIWNAWPAVKRKVKTQMNVNYNHKTDRQPRER